MPLFQSAVLKKYLKQQDQEAIAAAYATFTAHFHDAAIQANILEAKEEQYQEGFLRDLFVNVLGYTLNPQKGYELTSEFKNEKGSKKADGAILENGKALGVIELKGTDTTDLATINSQAFNYKANHTNCVYVVTSNFQKLRFFIDNAVDHLEFDLFTLNAADFALLWLCLQRDNLLGGLPKKVKADSLQEEEQVTKRLYKDYSTFKNALWQDLCTNHPEHDQLLLYKKTQKLLDRFLFVLFSEDKGLLPPNSIREITDQWEKLKDLDAYFPLYDRFQKYFGYLNTGHKGKHHDIFAYNGGLFKPDELLDNVHITDAVLHPHVLTLSKYDYSTEVDVNILGHIFEHSLNEIENVTAQLEGRAVDAKKSKRKKDGVFYTPKYITKYIVENTVGRLCQEKKEELALNDEDYAKGRKGRQKKTIQELDTKLDVYRDWLLSLTICDPACGSGAFLNQALDYLIAEHKYVDELQATLLGHSITFKDIGDHILERNIFGVDINEESVEIARLSLWLRTATKGRKLNDLSSNIKCGNSLIDDPAVAGDKAFDWIREFPSVFAKGGFDVVVGNPPYVKLETIREESEQLSRSKFSTFDKRGDLYVLFVEKAFNLCHEKGMVSYIMPNKWLQAGYGESLRRFLSTKNVVELIDFGDIQIFQGATTYPIILVAKNTSPSELFNASVLSTASIEDFHSNVQLNRNSYSSKDYGPGTWILSSGKGIALLESLNSKFPTLSEVVGGNALRGVLTGLSEAFIIPEETKLDIVRTDPNAAKHLLPFLLGREVTPYSNPSPQNYLILFEKGFTKTRTEALSDEEAERWLETEYPGIASWLKPFASRGMQRTDKGDYWWELRACDYYSAFNYPKIMYQKFQVKPCFIYDDTGVYCNDSMWIIPASEKGLVGVLNSKLGWWLISKYCTQIQNGYQLIWKYFSQIPVPEKTGELNAPVEKIIRTTGALSAVKETLVQLLQSKYTLPKLSRNLENWPTLDYKGFLKELKKAKVQLTLAEEAEWLAYFNEQKAKATALQQQITATDKQIDALVYELYGLTEEEVRVVEGRT